MARARKYKYKRRRTATVDSKARSMQSSWRKATNKEGTLSIADAKEIINDPPSCIYCGKPVLWANLSIDHVIPKSRDGSNEPDNLVWVDRECNITKGDLTGDEFKALLQFLEQHPRMKASVLSRLRAGGAVFGRKRWRRK